ncbi:MAG: hypothetical protein WDZ96_00795 [Acidimicrobiia bacterium]
MRLPAARFVGTALNPDYLIKIQPVTPETVTVLSAPRLMRRLWAKETGAMTIGKRIYVEPAVLERGGRELTALLMHEMVHSRQWQERGPVRFLASYIRQYLVARITGASHREAYLAIEAEVEARSISRNFSG